MIGEIVMYGLGAVFGVGLVGFILYTVVLGPMQGKKELARMESELPRLAEKYGLSFKQARSYSEFGKITGELKGHQVELRVDDSQQFRVQINRDIRCYITNEKLDREPYEEQGWFRLADPELDLFFKTKQASRELATRFVDPNARFDALSKLVREQGKELRLLTINDREIYASVKQRWATDFGEERRSYITPEQFARLLPALVDVAEELGDGSRDS